MKSLRGLAVMTTLLLAVPVAAAPLIEVAFVDPDRYADASPGNIAHDARGRQAAIADIRDHLVALGTKYLQPGDRLWIEIADVDLAGERKVLGSDRLDIRVLRDATPPRIRLRYVLARGDVRTAEEEELTRLDYLHDLGRCRAGGAFCREKALLSDWFIRRFGR